MDEWVHLRAEICGACARFHVDDMETPAPAVPKMFGGTNLHSDAGLYVDNGTERNFKNLQVTHTDEPEQQRRNARAAPFNWKEPPSP